jgi:hypothetical protein
MPREQQASVRKITLWGTCAAALADLPDRSDQASAPFGRLGISSCCLPRDQAPFSPKSEEIVALIRA